MTEDGAKQGSLAWAVERWHAEVQNRPMHNVHRLALDTTWRQVIRHFGGDPDELLSMPPHHEMSSTSGKPIAEAKLATIAKPVAWRVGVWGDGSTPPGLSNIFCDEQEATIVADIATHHAQVIVEAHNSALSERDAPQAQADWRVLAEQLSEKLKTKSTREIATEVGVGHATIARLANGKEPRISTYFAVLKWLSALTRPSTTEAKPVAPKIVRRERPSLQFEDDEADTEAKPVEALVNLITAWNALPEGNTPIREIERWLREDMHPAIIAGRAALAALNNDKEHRNG